PSWKDRYPLVSIHRYVAWMRDDGLPFDPWLRVHARLGGALIRPEPKSLRIEAPITEWERWTDMAFPEDGNYVFPFGLAPLSVQDRVGLYWEPNVWVLHEL
ncbi:MAG: GNAT family N-acetyltransferase, partial [Acidimicrobiales bacterium]